MQSFNIRMISAKNALIVLGSAALGATGTTIDVPEASADGDGNYGFIAYSPGTGAMGFALNYPQPEDAQARAMQECAQRDCKLVVGVRPPGHCIALAVNRPDKTIYDGGAGITRGEAENDALARVPGGVIVGWGCSGSNDAPTGDHGYVDW